MRKIITIKKLLLLLVLVSLLAVSAVFAQDKAAEKPEATLYERLGGVYSIATVVDELIERLEVNEEIMNANPAIDKARTSVPKAGIKFTINCYDLSGNRRT